MQQKQFIYKTKHGNLFCENLQDDTLRVFFNEEQQVVLPTDINGKKISQAFGFCLLADGTCAVGAVVCNENMVFPEQTNGKKVTQIYSFCGQERPQNVNKVKTVNIPQSVVEIGEQGLFNFDNITQLTLPQNLEKIGYFAIANCFKLTSIVVPHKVVCLDVGAFSHCKSLEKISLPDSLQTIGSNAFSCCDSLAQITIPKNVRYIGDYAFDGCDNLAEFVVDQQNQWFKTIDGNLYTKDEKTLVRYAPAKKQDVFVLPVCVQKVAEGAFDNTTNLQKIVLLNNVDTTPFEHKQITKEIK